jgi:hypothetical protein
VIIPTRHIVHWFRQPGAALDIHKQPLSHDPPDLLAHLAVVSVVVAVTIHVELGHFTTASDLDRRRATAIV